MRLELFRKEKLNRLLGSFGLAFCHYSDDENLAQVITSNYLPSNLTDLSGSSVLSKMLRLLTVAF